MPAGSGRRLASHGPASWRSNFTDRRNHNAGEQLRTRRCRVAVVGDRQRLLLGIPEGQDEPRSGVGVRCVFRQLGRAGLRAVRRVDDLVDFFAAVFFAVVAFLEDVFLELWLDFAGAFFLTAGAAAAREQTSAARRT